MDGGVARIPSSSGIRIMAPVCEHYGNNNLPAGTKKLDLIEAAPSAILKIVYIDELMKRTTPPSALRLWQSIGKRPPPPRS